MFKWGYLLREMTFPLFILSLILLISWGCWVYLELPGGVSLLLGLTSGLVLGIFTVLIALRELETIEEAHMCDNE